MKNIAEWFRNAAVRARILAATGAVALGMVTANAHAGAVGGAVVLPAAITTEYFGLNYADQTRTLNTFGTLDYNNGAGCGGICMATTTLGADPSLTIQVFQVPFDDGGGGDSFAEIGYYFEVNTSGTAYLHAGDSLESPANGFSQAYIGVGTADSEPQYFNNFATLMYQDTDCSGYCAAGVANYTAPAPLPANQPLSLVAGQVYYLQEWIDIGAATSETQLKISADPTISVAPGTTIYFSAGIGAVPEPASWAMMLIGAGILGAMLRISRRQAKYSRLLIG